MADICGLHHFFLVWYVFPYHLILLMCTDMAGSVTEGGRIYNFEVNLILVSYAKQLLVRRSSLYSAFSLLHCTDHSSIDIGFPAL